MDVRFALGRRSYAVKREDSAFIMSVCATASIACDRHMFTENDFCFSIPFMMSDSFEKMLAERKTDFRIVSETGLSPTLLRYKNRIGLLIGAVIFIIFAIFSSSFLWSIEICGNTALQSEELIEVLSEAGLTIGCYLPKTDTDSIESAVLAADGRISWISINLNGSIAYVEIRESVSIDRDERCLPYANIIASEDAIITGLEVFSGAACVKTDTQVKKGDLLISGIISKEFFGTHFTYANGNVYGKNYVELEIEVPFEYAALRETGKKFVAFEFNFFNKTLSIKRFNNRYDNYNFSEDTFLAGIGERVLPVSFDLLSYRETEYVTERRDINTARTQALEQLSNILYEEYSDANILSKEIAFSEYDDKLVLECGLWYERQIGITAEFEVEE